MSAPSSPDGLTFGWARKIHQEESRSKAIDEAYAHGFLGRNIRGPNTKDISWFSPSGEEMSDPDWDTGYTKCLAVRLAGDVMEEVDERGDPALGEYLDGVGAAQEVAGGPGEEQRTGS